MCVGHIETTRNKAGWEYGPSAAAEALLLHFGSALCNSADVEVSAIYVVMVVCQQGSSLCRSDYQNHSYFCKEVKLSVFSPSFLGIHCGKTFTEVTEKEQNET